ncbi:hypothetical protein BAUCODRAFT_24680 [Baudoinia panamericana UAMH 10762]|uniref:Helicase C-terminal domain-containing protein n=1 Tax=Baudoinia panamericana (strain UAMH 10762) TaxID=717646 RepID=M2LMU3_BAUPA|nr:uncharacterized protein BAUCODRAFT_24680 [Baudoinia panamericana UAMH 10762]EMC95652.1 hypothetical protein BAUCODRAFT_24680 [Baudoinia panamericana UAMH 10762]
MAVLAASRKRRFTEAANTAHPDSDCTVVSSVRKKHAESAATGTALIKDSHGPLYEIQHNKRRRIVECVLLPKKGVLDVLQTASCTPPETQRSIKKVQASKSASGIAKYFQTSAIQHSNASAVNARARNTSPTDQHAGVVSPQAAPEPYVQHPVTALRPRRSTGAVSQRAYHEDSEDDGLQLESLPQKKGRIRRRKVIHDDEEYNFIDDQPTGDEHCVSETTHDGTAESSDVSASESAEPVKPATAKAVKNAFTRLTGKISKRKGIGTSGTPKKLLSRPKDIPKGLVSNLPPLNSVRDIFRDITTKALSLGFAKAVKHLNGRCLRVATMCSGTESPLLALSMVDQSLAEKMGQGRINVEHVFSAEIVPYKQAYIERNFAPPVIFRDITEFPKAFESEKPTATTAYGSRVPIPTGIDILILGTSCVDYSGLNNKQKDIDDGGESGRTWYGALAYCKACRPSIIIFENVVSAKWDRMLSHYTDLNYECACVIVDTKDYYIPQTRQRGYMVCFDKLRAGTNVKTMGVQWQGLMEQFKRYASSPVSSFLLPNDRVTPQQTSRGDDQQGSKDVAWELCEIRQIGYRAAQRLGTARPFTLWQESGAMLPLEGGDRAWFNRLVEREKDTIDAAYLRASLPSGSLTDGRYKTKIWDISQNIERISNSIPNGITGCLTPSGKPYISDAKRILAPGEALQLQGLPLDQISFTTETQGEVRDLAGNAMTTSVVGPAILAALISGYSVLPPAKEQRSADQTLSEPTSGLSTSRDMLWSTETCGEGTEMDLQRLLGEARASMRLCHCEGSLGRTSKALQRCIDCGHTACVTCGGNPAHAYQRESQTCRSNPLGFIEMLLGQIPLRVSFGEVSITDVWPRAETKQVQSYVEAAQKALCSTFTYHSVRRTQSWTVQFISEDARLELVVEPLLAEWRLYALPAKELPANSWLRHTLLPPIAKASVSGSFYGDGWSVRMPTNEFLPLQVKPAGRPTPTWWARNEMPQFHSHTQPDMLEISLVDTVAEPAISVSAMLSGTYRLFPKCGTACCSLYRKLDKDETKLPLYLFLDCTRTGSSDEDCFVFAHSCADIEYDELRQLIARIVAPWRPWKDIGTDGEQSMHAEARIALDSKWVTSEGLRLMPADTSLRLGLSEMEMEIEGSSACDSAQHLVTCEGTSVAAGHSGHTNLSFDIESISSRIWILEAMRRKLDYGEWRTFALEASSSCLRCAPERPQLKWKLSDKQNKSDKQELDPYEDPGSAAAYERAIKSRPEPLVVQTPHDSAGITFGVNIVSLAHRVLARLPTSLKDAVFSWRLTTDHANKSTTFPHFKLRPTSGETYDGTVLKKSTLFPTQRLQLAWMIAQEAGVDFVIEESQEATLPVVGWRTEVRANVSITVRGGFCCDHPGFGKTITSLALISAQRTDPLYMHAELSARRPSQAQGLYTSIATVIVCPSHLIAQWNREIAEFFPARSKIIVVKQTSDLSKYTISDFESSDIIVVSRTILDSESYINRLAAFAGLPGPAVAAGTGRGFARWLDYAHSQIPEHLAILRSRPSKCTLEGHIVAKYKRLLSDDGFKATIPSQRFRGKDVAKTRKARSKTTAGSLWTEAVTPDMTHIGRPLLQMFYFDRIIIDEFHLLEPKERAAVTALHADKRWGLSGTPPIDDFYDIAELAGLMGVPLRYGSDARGVMKVSNIRRLRREMTDFEKFDAMRETPSNEVYTRIHEIDQRFLDTFVRQNLMDFGDGMRIMEILTPVSLSLEHKVLYTELSQHLNSLEMRIKTGRKSQDTHRGERLHRALSTSDSSEDALAKTAAYFPTNDYTNQNGFGLEAFVAIRIEELQLLRQELAQAICEARSKEKDAFDVWTRTWLDYKHLADDETIATIKSLLAAGPGAVSVRKPAAKAKKLAESEEDDAEMGSKTSISAPRNSLTSKVNELSKRMAVSTRSLRYLQNVAKVRDAATAQCDRLSKLCQGNACTGEGNAKDTAVSALCGHIICYDCFQTLGEQHSTQCPAAGCGCSMQPHHLLWRQKMGDPDTTNSMPHGAKLAAVVDILKNVRAQNDKAILFVQYEEQVAEAQRAFEAVNIRATPITTANKAADTIEAFTKNENTVIILNASDDTAAGLNLQCANHVIFLSPLLRDTQYGYDSTMAQAIGRVRRHGQQKTIYVYRVVAINTIDVDILQHRERRRIALVEQGAPPIEPLETTGDEVTAERTKLVRINGRFSLQPRSWVMRYNGVEDLEDFSSLVKFSRAYTDDDD